MTSTADTFLHNWFPSHMLVIPDPVVEAFRSVLLATCRHGLAGSWAAVRDTDLRDELGKINRLTLMIAGRDDTVTAASHSERIAGAIPGSKRLVLPAVHLSNIEYPEAFLATVLAFLPVL